MIFSLIYFVLRFDCYRRGYWIGLGFICGEAIGAWFLCFFLLFTFSHIKTLNIGHRQRNHGASAKLQLAT